MSNKADFLQLQYDFASHIRDPLNNPAPQELEDRRMAIYRDLFFSNQLSFITNTFPVMTELLGEQRVEKMVRGFFAKHPNHSPYFREIPRVFLEYLETIPTPEDLPFLHQLARYEWLELHLMVHEDPQLPDYTITQNNDKLLNQPLLLNPLLFIEHYNWPVQHISLENIERISAQETFIILYRDTSHTVRFFTVNALTALFWDILKCNQGITASAAIAAVSEHAGTPTDALKDDFLQIIKIALRDDIVLGVTMDCAYTK